MRCPHLTVAVLSIALGAGVAAQQRVEKSNMEMVGYDDLQGRSAYQPVIQKQGARWIAYIGQHGGVALNPLTGKQEPNGTSIVDVTNPKQPKYLAHIPGEAGQGEAGGAQMVRVCNGSDLPRADKSKVYLLRSLGTVGHETWDVTDPAKPSRMAVVVSGLRDTHKSWWECDTGVAFPPAFVRVAEPAHHDRHAAWLRRVGDVPGLVADGAEAAQQVHLALVCARQVAAVAHPHHLRASGFALAGFARNMGEVLGLLRIGHVDDRCAVGLLLAGKRIEGHATVLADVGDPARALLLDDGLIGAPALKVVVADHLHVGLFNPLLRCHTGAVRDAQYRDRKMRTPHLKPPFFVVVRVRRRAIGRSSLQAAQPRAGRTNYTG